MITKSIEIHFFEVGSGDSILLKFLSADNEAEYVVIDCNKQYNNNKVFNFLKSENVKKINTLIITHLHQDHYSGISDLIDNFEINKLLIPPFISSNREKLRLIIEKYKEELKKNVSNMGENESVIKKFTDLTKLIKFINENCDNGIVEEATGKENILRFSNIGNKNIESRIYLPLKKIKGILHKAIVGDKFNVDCFKNDNEMSIVLGINAFGINLLFTGDSTSDQWLEHKRLMNHDGIENLNIQILKASHHGSKHNNNKEIYSYILTPNLEKQKFLIISANGTSHPDKEIFSLITEFSLKPYCTNLSKFCNSPYLLQKDYATFPEEMRLFLSNYKTYNKNFGDNCCFGDIEITIDQSKKITVKTQKNAQCIYC